MSALSIWHILIFVALALLLFGGQGKISGLMGDIGRGIKAFRSGLMQPDSEIAPVHAEVTDTRRETVKSRIGGDTVSETRTTAATNLH
jgi:sec-independent protein translocase protein TatA